MGRFRMEHFSKQAVSHPGWPRLATGYEEDLKEFARASEGLQSRREPDRRRCFGFDFEQQLRGSGWKTAS